MGKGDQELGQAFQENWFAMRLSLIVGLLMLGGKGAAYLLTDSAAILSDAIESVIHVIAVAFAAFSLWLSRKPVNRQFTYGYERVSFFSAGFEGALIILAAFAIIVAAVQKWLSGTALMNLSVGTGIVLAAGLLNAGLGWYILRTGKRTKSIILEANGRHVLTDSWTSLGVVGGLGLVRITGWGVLDSVFAIAVAVNIIWSGGKLILASVGGLMDYADPEVGKTLRERLDTFCEELGIQYHGVRFRSTGYRLQVEVHLLFPFDVPLGVAHSIATRLEEEIPLALGQPAEVVTHLESLEDHGKVHAGRHYTGRPAPPDK